MTKEGQGDIAVVGLAVMGQNLILNMNDHGFKVVAFNRTVAKVDEFLAGPAKGTQIIGAHSIKEVFSQLKRPRKIMCMIKAGEPVDELIEECLPYFEKGDIFIDGGNSHYPDSERRFTKLKEKGVLFVGTGISGGEEGARHGPSIMPGGNPDAWPYIKPIFQAIAAKSDNGEPCCDWVGDGGAGHYVKMVHNGIEYGDMQIICEAYHLLSASLGCTHEEMSKIFAEWNKGKLDSYLIDITKEILKYKEPNGTYLVDKILDTAGQKGTGKWTGINALDLGMPVTLIGEAVFARCLSSLKDQRVAMEKRFPHQKKPFKGDKNAATHAIHDALYASKIISYTQGFMLMAAAAKEMNWKLNYGSIALMWRGGCIIRSKFLGKIKEAFAKNPNLQNLLFDDFFKHEVEGCVAGWRKALIIAIESGIPTPCFSTSLAFFDGLTTANLPANLLQAQRDYFGAHTYERTDKPRGQFFHTNWTGTGGNVSSSTYNA